MANETSWAYMISDHKAPGGAGPGAARMTKSSGERDLKTTIFVEDSIWLLVISLVIIVRHHPNR